MRRNGFATFTCDSFVSRGVERTSERQLACTMANLQYDSYAALQLLATHPDIDSNRIGCVGWSLGEINWFFIFLSSSSFICFSSELRKVYTLLTFFFFHRWRSSSIQRIKHSKRCFRWTKKASIRKSFRFLSSCTLSSRTITVMEMVKSTH